MTGRIKRKTKSGDIVWLQASYNPILDLNNRPFKVMKYATDITEQVKITEDIQSLIANNLTHIEESVSNVGERTQAASKASQLTFQNVQAVATGAEQMGAAIAEIAHNMSKSKQAVASMDAKTKTTETATVTLEETARRMSDIVDTITKIAEQTNLLALNATIEAARAGDAGKGFSVVASEVKNLAGKVATAMREIKEQIETLQEQSSEVAQAMIDIKEAMSNVTEYISTSASAVEEQSAVSRDIAANMQSASKAVEQVTTNISQIDDALQTVHNAVTDTDEAAKNIA